MHVFRSYKCEVIVMLSRIGDHDKLIGSLFSISHAGLFTTSFLVTLHPHRLGHKNNQCEQKKNRFNQQANFDMSILDVLISVCKLWVFDLMGQVLGHFATHAVQATDVCIECSNRDWHNLRRRLSHISVAFCVCRVDYCV